MTGHFPKEVGQSGTASPASLLVTSAPATSSRKVQPASAQVNWCSRRLYWTSVMGRPAPVLQPVRQNRFRLAGGRWKILFPESGPLLWRDRGHRPM